jgi:hypothetical protein
VNPGAPEGLTIPTRHVTPVVIRKHEIDPLAFEKLIFLKGQPLCKDDRRMFAVMSRSLVAFLDITLIAYRIQ